MTQEELDCLYREKTRAYLAAIPSREELAQDTHLDSKLPYTFRQRWWRAWRAWWTTFRNHSAT